MLDWPRERLSDAGSLLLRRPVGHITPKGLDMWSAYHAAQQQSEAMACLVVAPPKGISKSILRLLQANSSRASLCSASLQQLCLRKRQAAAEVQWSATSTCSLQLQFESLCGLPMLLQRLLRGRCLLAGAGGA